MTILEKQSRFYATLFILPLLVSFVIFFVWAFGRAFYLSFTDFDLFTPNPNWVGLQNYFDLFLDPLFLRALFNSLSYMVIVTVIQVFLALCVASLLNQKIRGILVFRTVYYIPCILSSAAVTLVFMWIYQKTGFLNYSLSWLSAHAPLIISFLISIVALQTFQYLLERRMDPEVTFFDPAIGIVSLLVSTVLIALLVVFGVLSPGEAEKVDVVWLNTRSTFLGLPVTLWAIIIQNIYTTVPTYMIIFLAGLQDIPSALYEAAKIDGANTFQKFFLIDIPLLRPVTFLVLTMSLIGTIQLFDQVALLGTAAPLESRISLAYYVYNSTFPPGGTPQVGMGSAAAIILAVLSIGVVGIQKMLGISEKGV